jgi:demethylmenaquinone methyltransferase/2-methoxy-6-polyprenyl-1,4-benzoquinol methylase
MIPKRAGKTYDRLSRFYHSIESLSEAAPRRAGLAMLAAQPGEAVLELGPGTGSALEELARATSPGGYVVGVDLSPGMLRQARRRVPLEVSLIQGDARLLPLRSGSLDAIFASFTIELFSETEIVTVLAECRRVLHPSGRMQLVCLGMGHGKAHVRRLYEGFHRRFPSAIDCRPIDALKFSQQAGFSISACEEISLYGIPVDVVLALK